MAPDGKNRREYENRVNRVIDHIQAHRAGPIGLEQMARIAAFSPFHFHRVFRSITGENLGEFVQRVRLEWAASALVQRPGADVLEIALDSGFQSASSFARAFKEHFGMTATAWRQGGACDLSKQRKAESNPGQAERKARNARDDGREHAAEHGADAPVNEETPMNVTIKTFPTHRLAYMRHVGPYGAGGGVPQLWMRLARWAGPRELWTPDRLCFGIAHDNPQVTEPAKCRYDACIVIPDDFRLDTQVNEGEFPAGKVALFPFEGTGETVGACWERVFREWLPQSGYQPDDRPFFEVYTGDAFDEKTGVVRCELGLPVRPL